MSWGDDGEPMEDFSSFVPNPLEEINEKLRTDAAVLKRAIWSLGQKIVELEDAVIKRDQYLKEAKACTDKQYVEIIQLREMLAELTGDGLSAAEHKIKKEINASNKDN
jgi:hypothetical protein